MKPSSTRLSYFMLLHPMLLIGFFILSGHPTMARALSPHQEPLNLPSAQDFLKLSEREQLDYLTEWRKIAAQMNDQSKFFAGIETTLGVPFILKSLKANSSFLKIIELSGSSLLPSAAAVERNIESKIAESKLAWAQLSVRFKSLSGDDSEIQTAAQSVRAGLLKDVFGPLDIESGKIRDRLRSKKGSAADDAADKKALADILQAYSDLKRATFEEMSKGLTPSSKTRINQTEETLRTRIANIDKPIETKVFAQAGGRNPVSDRKNGSRSGGSGSTGAASNQRGDTVAANSRGQTATTNTVNTGQVKTVAALADGGQKNAKLPPATEGATVPPLQSFKTKGCMYAGFILIADTCDRPQRLPNQFKDQKSLDLNTFACASGEVICNPLLFGYDVTLPEGDKTNCEKLDTAPICKDFKFAKPICIRAAKTATRDCLEKAKPTEKYNERALALIKANPELFNQYVKDFQKICDNKFLKENSFIYFDQNGNKRKNPEYYSDDISTTCEKAAPKFRELYKTTFKKDFEWAPSIDEDAKARAGTLAPTAGMATGNLKGEKATRAPVKDATKDGANGGSK